MAKTQWLVPATVCLLAVLIPAARGQDASAKWNSITLLPAEQTKRELGFDPGKFKQLESEWLTKPMNDDDLLTLGKGLIATSPPSSSESKNGVQIIKQLAEKGSANANLVLGLWGENPELQTYVGDPTNYLLAAAKEGNAPAQQAIGRKLVTPGFPDFDAVSGFNWLTKSVESGNVAAKVDLAASYEFGIGVKPNLAKSDELLKSAAQTGDAQLLRDYAEFKLRNGASYSDTAVVGLLEQAAKQNDFSAQLILADQALSAGQDYTSAVMTLTTLASQGDDLAMVRLGKYYLSSARINDAVTNFQSAAHKGNTEAQAELGTIYVSDFAKDPQKLQLGRQLLASAASAGNPRAIIALATPTVSPDLDSVSRFTQGLHGFELSGGTTKDAFNDLKLSACDPASAQVPCDPVPVFYFTNRKPDQMANGEVSYENLMAPSDQPLSYGLSLAYAPALPPKVAGPPPTKFWDILSQAISNVQVFRSLSTLFQRPKDKPNTAFDVHSLAFAGDLRTFVKSIHSAAVTTDRPKAFVYVHGFANSFESAVDRIALLSQQYNFPGIPIVFSWASAATPLGSFIAENSGSPGVAYVSDMRVAKASCPAFQKALAALVEEFGSGNVMVLAHSMGGELAIDMLTACGGGGTWNAALKLGPLIFAAPDVSQEYFKDESKMVVTRAASTLLYTSQNDLALVISQKFGIPGSRRAGQGGSGLLIIPPVQTIDASQVEAVPGGDPNNHGYVFDTRQVRQDVVAVLRNTPLDQRDCIINYKGQRDPPGTQVGSDPDEYWMIEANCQ